MKAGYCGSGFTVKSTEKLKKVALVLRKISLNKVSEIPELKFNPKLSVSMID